MKLISLLFFISSSLWATTFNRVPISSQVKDSEGIIVGHFLKQKSVKLEDGSIATQMFFKMNKEYGFQSDFFGMDEVIVHFPGGTVDGITREVHGVPRFVPGEHVALFTRNIQNRSWGMNLAYGTFRVVNYGKEVMLLNSLFPEDPEVGQISLEKFEALIKSIKGSNLKVVQAIEIPESYKVTASRVPASASERQNRSLASKNEETENSSGDSGIDYTWLLACLALMGGAVRFMRSKRMP